MQHLTEERKIMSTTVREDIIDRVYGIGFAVPDLDTMDNARRMYLYRFMAHLLAGLRMSPHGRGVYQYPRPLRMQGYGVVGLHFFTPEGADENGTA
jgi:hypothetical protein